MSRDYDTWLTTVPNEKYCSRHDLIYIGEHDCEEYEADLVAKAEDEKEEDDL